MSAPDIADPRREPPIARTRDRLTVTFTLSDETARALPVIVPVGLGGAVCLAAAILTWTGNPPSVPTMAGTLVLLAAAVAAEALPLPIEGVDVGSTSLGLVFIVAASTLYGRPAATLVASLSVAIVQIARRRSFARIVFNAGLYALAGALAGAVAATWGGDSTGAVVVASCLASVAFYAVNMSLLAAVVARTDSTAFVRSLRRYVWATGAPFLVLTSIATTFVLLWELTPAASLVVVAPLVVVALYQRWLHGALTSLREFDRMKDEFLAVISHELRTPLTSVYGAALTLQKREVDAVTRTALLTIIVDEAARLSRLLDDALSASRLHADRESFDIAAVDAVAIARTVVEAELQRLPDGLDLDLVAQAGLPHVAADADKLRQVLVNLTGNAIKYSPSGGRIEVDVERAGDAVRFSVRDEGLGVPEADQPHVFERFYRVDPNMTRGVGGTGLGLYICRELVLRMGGRIWLTSRPGHGSTFAFELPSAPRD